MTSIPASADPAARRDLVRARVAVSAAFFVSGGGLGVWAAHIPLLKSGLALDDAALGLALLGMGVGAMSGMPVAGPLTHWLGSARATVLAGFAYALVIALPPSAPALPFLVFSAFLIGALVGILDVAMNAHAGAIERALGRPIMSSVHAFFSLGGLAGAGLASGLIALDVGAVAGMAAGAAALVAIMVLATPRLPIPVEAAPAGPAFRLPTLAVLGIGLLALLSFVTEGAMLDWSGVYLNQVTGASPALAAWGYAAVSAAMTVCRLLGDRIVDRFGPVRTVQWSGAIGAAGLGVVIAAQNPAVALAGFVLVGVGFANVVPVLFSAAGRIPGVPPAHALAMVATVGYGGGLMGPPVIGFLSDASGLRVALLVLVAAAVAIALGASRAISPPPRSPGG